MLSTIESVNNVVNNFIWGVPAMICIIGVGLLLSVRTGFIQIRKFPYAMKVTIGRMLRKKDATDGAMTQAATKTALDGKASSSHTHNYAGSSSAGGVANSANKLATPRKINGIAFDGTRDINNVIYTTKKEYDALVKAGTYNKSAMYVTTPRPA